MKLGIVLSQTPAHSETFFNSKIKGLLENGHDVTLFVQNKHLGFSLCKVIEAPKVYKKNNLLQAVQLIVVIFKLIKCFSRVKKFILLEKGCGRSWNQILKNCYNNSHLLDKKLDWIHFGFATLALQSENVASAISAKMAISLRGFDIAIYPIKFPKCYTLLWKKVDKIHTISDDLLSLAYDEGLPVHIPFQKITPAIDINLFKGTESILNTNLVQILSVSRLHWKKGLLYTLEALCDFKANGYMFHYNIIGSGPEHDEIIFTIHQLGLQNQVTLLGNKTPKEVRDYMKNTSVYIQYSVSEGFCNSVLEAQAMGLLCIVSDAEGLTENVMHEETGWVIPKRKPKVLADIMSKVVGLSEQEQLNMQTKAMKRVQKQFNLEKQKKEFIEFYN